jgi:pyruvate carboxylase
MRGFFYGVSEDEELVVDLEAGVRPVIELKAISEQTQRTCAQC